MESELHLRVVTPDRTVMDNKVRSVQFMGTDGSAYCLSEAPDADAVLKSHQALGIPQTLEDIKEVNSLV